MKQKSIVISGESTDLKYRLCEVEPSVRKNVWEICLVSIGLNFTSDIDKIISVSTNYVQEETLTKDNQKKVLPSTMSLLRCKGKAGGKSLVGLKQKTFFEVNSPQEYLEVYLNDMEGNGLAGLSAHVHLLLRRKT